MDKVVVISRMKHYAEILAILIVLALIGFFIYSVYKLFNKPPVDTSVAVIAPPSAAIKGELTMDTTLTVPIKTYRPKVKKTLRLPDPVIANPDQQVTGSTTVKPSEHAITVTSVIDTKTGTTTTYEKPEPSPWIALEARGEVRLDGLYKFRDAINKPVARLSIVHDFVQVKGFHLGAVAGIDTDRERYLGIGIGYRY